MASGLEQAGNGIAEDGITTVPDTERTGGIGADKLHHDLFSFAYIGKTKILALLIDGRKHGAPDR